MSERIGPAPHERELACKSTKGCEDVLALQDGRLLVVGTPVTYFGATTIRLSPEFMLGAVEDLGRLQPPRESVQTHPTATITPKGNVLVTGPVATAMFEQLRRDRALPEGAGIDTHETVVQTDVIALRAIVAQWEQWLRRRGGKRS